MQEKETAIEFAQRVKADICRRGGLVDLPWCVDEERIILCLMSNVFF